jgi:hypothetical protein
MSDTRMPTVHLTLPLAPEASPTHIHIEDEGCHSAYDDRGNPTDAEELAETLRTTLPGNLYEDLLRVMLREELEFSQEMGEHERSEVWYSAYMLMAGDPDAAYAPWATIREYERLLANTGDPAEREVNNATPL